MIRLYFSVLLLLIANCKQADDCTRGTRAAEADVKSGVTGLYYFGLPNPSFNTRTRILIEKYHIVVKGGGDIISEEGTCYNKVMTAHIKKKYGDDLFERVDNTVDSLYALGLGDRELAYRGGNDTSGEWINHCFQG